MIAPFRSVARRVASRALPAALLVAPLVAGGALLHSQGGPPYSPEEALKTFRLAEGFQVELVAAEPLVSDPVAMEVDEQGRVYVVEMHGYPLDLGGSGRVILLRDADGDGRADGSTVFADGLRLPTGIMRWKKGVLVTDSPEVWYLEDTDGDGRADVKEAILTGFALSNPQHNTASPVYGLDNWIYLANEGPVRTTRYAALFGDAGAPVRFAARPAGPRLPPDADGRNVRFRPDTHELEALSARSQFGQAFDVWGRHFGVSNARPIYHEVVAARYLARNPRLAVPGVIEQLPDYGLPVEVYPTTVNPEFQLLTDVGVMTAASGLTLYQADLFPERWRGAAFVAEGAHNLVHASAVRPHGPTFRSSRILEGKEFLSSTDPWFRPVNFYLGPDGALYLIDYYRRVLEHPEWLDEATSRSPELYAGRDRGRIYRITPAGTPRAGWMGRLRLGDATTAELVRALSHPNAWWRRTAQRLLLDRRAPDALAPLRAAAGGPSPEGRVHALWTLEGLGLLDPPTLERALADSVPGVRENAVRLAEPRLRGAPAIARRLLAMADDPDARVRFQLLLTLGEIDTPEARGARDGLLFREVEDGWTQIAALSARGADAMELLDAAVGRLAGRDTPGGRALVSRLGSMVALGGDAGEALRLVEEVAGADTAPGWWRAAALEGLSSGLRGARAVDAALAPVRERVARLALDDDDAATRRAAMLLLETTGLPAGSGRAEIERAAERAALDAGATAESRADAIRLLALGDATAHAGLLVGALAPGNPEAVQLAAVRALARAPGAAHAEALLAHWRAWSPAVRLEAARALARDPARARVLVDALVDRRVEQDDLDRALRTRLLALDDAALRERARALFSVTSASGRDAVERYRAVLSLEGDAPRGRQVYARVCSSCHQFRGAGGTPFGPDLGEVGSALPFSLLTDILYPNQSIADGFELRAVHLQDGSALTGIVTAETATAMTVRRLGAPELVLPRSQVASVSILEVSAMPEGLDSQIAPQEMADLIAFLRSGSR